LAAGAGRERGLIGCNPFARTIDSAKKYVVSSTLDRVDWNAELVCGDPEKAVQQFKRESKRIDLKLVSRLEFGSGAVAMRYERRRYPLGLLSPSRPIMEPTRPGLPNSRPT
jgi:hypothetical protein